VNLYLIEDGGGWALVDTGIGTIGRSRRGKDCWTVNCEISQSRGWS